MTLLTPLSRRLAEPALRLTLDELAHAWFVQSIEARLPVMGALSGRAEEVLPKVRGAWGRRLLEGASPEAVAEQPCPWDPPCARDVFFREQIRAGRIAVPKPYVFEADRDGPDLIVRLKVFGFASAWTAAAADRLAEALNHHMDWRGLSGMANLRDPRVTDLNVITVQGLEVPPAPAAFSLHTVTPIEDERGELVDRPWKVIAGAARRIWGLARWHDAELTADWGDLSAAWQSCDARAIPHGGAAEPLLRHGRAKGFLQAAFRGEIHIEDAPPDLWTILTLAQTCGAGRGAVHGLGRFALSDG
jgi:hypothetical protein